MLPIRNLAGDYELLTGLVGLERNRRVNGDYVVTFAVITDDTNQQTYGMVDFESIVEFDGTEYVIKIVEETDHGEYAMKQATAIDRFASDMNDDVIDETRSGSITLSAALGFVFNGMSYTFNIIDSFAAREIENLGDDDRWSIFQRILASFGAEYRRSGNMIYIEREIGSNSDAQYRYGHNVKTINKRIDSNDLSTYIKGYGKKNEDGTYVVQADYTSPNIDVLGLRKAPTVRDEHYTTMDGLMNRLVNDLKDEPEISLTIDFVDLRASGYLPIQPQEGDYVWLIYEPLGLDIDVRIVEIIESYNARLEPVRTDITLSNIRADMVDEFTRFSIIEKRMDRLYNGQEPLPYSALDEAVRLATEAITSAQTELSFENGIVAVDKVNPNKLVVLNSAGLGISRDAGATFHNAITGDGVVAELITAGMLRGQTFASENADTAMWIEGGNIRLEALSGRYMTQSPSGMYGYNANGSVRFQADSSLVTSAAFGTSNTNTYLVTAAGGETRSVAITSIPGSGLVSDYTYVDHRAKALYANVWNINAGVDGVHLYARPFSAGELRVTLNGTTDNFQPIRVSGVYANTVDNNTQWGISDNMYIRPSSGGEARITRLGTIDAFLPIRASDFITSSSVMYKTDIADLEDDGLYVINNLAVKKYRLQTDIDAGIYNNEHVGLISELSPEVASMDGQAIVLYKLLGYTVKAAQELSALCDAQQTEINEIKEAIGWQT